MVPVSARRSDPPEREASATDPAGAPDRPPDGGGGRPGGARGSESCGPVGLVRVQKDDGRALILFSRHTRG